MKSLTTTLIASAGLLALVLCAAGCRTVHTGGQTVHVTGPFRGAAGTAEAGEIEAAGAINIVIVTGDGTQDAAKSLRDVGNPAASTAAGTANNSGPAANSGE